MMYQDKKTRMLSDIIAQIIQLIIGLTVLSACSLLPTTKQPLPPVKAASFVDPNAYAGMWYELVAFPTFFQANCHCSMLYYTPGTHGRGQAITGCIKAKSHHISIRKIRTQTIKGSGSAKQKLEIMWPFQHSYWILYVDKHYRYTLTGTPNRRYLWLLSRQPSIPSSVYHSILGIAKKQGYNLKRLKVSQQQCSPTMRNRLIQRMTSNPLRKTHA